jgi:hypothetical protein
MRYLTALALAGVLVLAGAAYAAISDRTAVPAAASSHGATSATGLLQRDKAAERSLSGLLRLAQTPCPSKCHSALSNCLSDCRNSSCRNLCYELYGTCMRNCRRFR